MEESKQILTEGQGTPYVSIFDGKKQAIIDGKNNLPIGMLVVFFTYEYDEEDGDKAEIVIETDNIDLLDQPEFGDKMPLILQWGYILPDGTYNVSPVRRVIIRDVEWDGNENGIRLTIKCSDLLSLLKGQSSTVANDDFEKWLGNNLADVPYAKILDYRLIGKLQIGNTVATWDIDRYAPIEDR